MNLKVNTNHLTDRWPQEVKINMWKSREDTQLAIYSKFVDRKDLIIALIQSDRILTEECVIIMKNITDLMAIIYYKEEEEIELMVGKTLGNSQRISFFLLTNDLVTLLQEI